MPPRIIKVNDSGNATFVSTTARIRKTLVVPKLNLLNLRFYGDLPWIIVILESVLIISGIIAFYAYLITADHSNISTTTSAATEAPKTTPLLKYQWPEKRLFEASKFKKVAVVSNSGLCNDIGRKILILGGNAIDSAIATLVCIGATNPQSSGIGGGHFMTLYNSRTRKCTVIDARETAPLRSRPAMYKSIATPGELHGLWTAYENYGSKRISWYDLISPTVSICKTGIPVSKELSDALNKEKSKIMEEVSMREFINPATGNLYSEGELMYRIKLAETLERIAEADDPVELFYKREIGVEIVNEMKLNGIASITVYSENLLISRESNIDARGLIDEADLEDYVTSVYADENVLVNDHFHAEWSICGPPPPSSFAVTQAIISVIFHIYENRKKKNLLYENVDFYHSLMETEKFAYAQRLLLGDIIYVDDALTRAKNMTNLEYARNVISLIKEKVREPEYYGELYDVEEDHGTSHVSVIDEEGNAVSCTSSINSRFGSLRMSPSLGIIWNSQIDDFSLKKKSYTHRHKQSESNMLRAGKKPMSSMSPTIVYNRRTGNAKAVFGATGGLKIIASIATALIRCLLFNETLSDAIDMPYIYSQFSPYVIQYEKGFPEALIVELEKRGHQTTRQINFESNVYGILVDDNNDIFAYIDRRCRSDIQPYGY